LPPAWRERVSVIEIEIVWSDAAALDALLDRVTERAHD
jgi:hypothetical protein